MHPLPPAPIGAARAGRAAPSPRQGLDAREGCPGGLPSSRAAWPRRGAMGRRTPCINSAVHRAPLSAPPRSGAARPGSRASREPAPGSSTAGIPGPARIRAPGAGSKGSRCGGDTLCSCPCWTPGSHPAGAAARPLPCARMGACAHACECRCVMKPRVATPMSLQHTSAGDTRASPTRAPPGARARGLPTRVPVSSAGFLVPSALPAGTAGHRPRPPDRKQPG